MGPVRHMASAIAGPTVTPLRAARDPATAARSASIGYQNNTRDQTGLDGLGGEEDQAAGARRQPVVNELQL